MRSVLVGVVAALALSAGPTAWAVVDIGEIHPVEVANLDVRPAGVEPTAAQLAAVEALGATARFNELGTPQSLLRHGGFLATGIGADTAADAAFAWLDENKKLFRLSSLDGLELVSEGELRGSSGHAVLFRQTFGGLAASPDGALVVGVVGSADTGWSVAYVSSRLAGDTELTGTAELTAREAWVAAAEAVGEDAALADVSVEGRESGWTRLEVEGFDEPQSVRAAAFPTRNGAIRAFETTVVAGDDHGHAEAYWQVVDARNGRVLFRESVVYHALDNPKWKVFPAYPQMTPLNRYPWNYPSADTRDLWCWQGAPACKLELADSSPHPAFPWDVIPPAGASTFTTTGNYARSAENWFNFLFPGPSQYQPVSATRDYVYPFRNVWFEEECNPDVLVVGSGNDIDAATTNLFAGHNRMHNWSYHLGFSEQAWNAQEHNFGMGTAENDPLIGMVQAGAVSHGPPTYAGRDNAFMRTLPDGTPSQSAMFLWQPIPGAFYAPCVDGDYDMAVIGHEYTHMIENRMIGKGANRMGFHAGAMGESYADFVAMEYLNEYDLLPGGDMAWAVGPYVTGNTSRAIRNYNMSWPSAGDFPQEGRYTRSNPLNFGSVGYDIVGPQVHADGEIWSATNYGIRELFVDRYGGGEATIQRECADGDRPVTQCPGNRRWMQIVFDAFLLMPTAPTFLDARDAYLAADMMRFGGANQDLLWLGFARRGFGEDASTTGTQDTFPVPSYESPLHGEATLTFAAVAKDEGGAPIADAQVFVGHYEGRTTPIPSVSGFVPNAEGYDFVARAPGYGHVRFHVSNLSAGESRTITIHMPSNWASQSQGATASGDGANHGNLIDDTEATNWSATGAPAQGRQVLVTFAGPRTFDVAKASAMLVPGQNRFVALRSFELYACTAGAAANPTCDPAVGTGWRRILKSRSNAFPADNPRPVAPALTLRTFNVPRTTATHVLLRVVDNQCTGQTSFQGKQDADPRHETDCRIGTPLPARNTQVVAAELQLQSSTPSVDGAQFSE
ncbi:MAG TPA: M36 family metallopeptidase [Gaiellaceae bacterium]|nr:M36 family metallopeptidase [Gaiellaceae bacterium]